MGYKNKAKKVTIRKKMDKYRLRNKCIDLAYEQGKRDVIEEEIKFLDSDFENEDVENRIKKLKQKLKKK